MTTEPTEARRDELATRSIKMNRLLTDDCHVDGLREKVIPKWDIKYTHEQNELRLACEAQRDLTRAETLKEVGEWLGTLRFHRGVAISQSEIEALKRGEKPKE